VVALDCFSPVPLSGALVPPLLFIPPPYRRPNSMFFDDHRRCLHPANLFSALKRYSAAQNQVWRPRRDLNPCYRRETVLVFWQFHRQFPPCPPFITNLAEISRSNLITSIESVAYSHLLLFSNKKSPLLPPTAKSRSPSPSKSATPISIPPPVRPP
jgi:hypothetical protein